MSRKNQEQTEVNTYLYDDQNFAVGLAALVRRAVQGCKCVVVPVNQGTEEFSVQMLSERCDVHKEDGCK